MAETDDVTVDFDAIDAEVAKGKGAEGKTAANGSEAAPTVVIDDDLAAKTGEAAVVTPDEGVQKLKKQLDDEKTLRIAAESRAREASNAEANARGETQKSQLDLLKGAIEQTTQQNDVLEKQLADAYAAQDFAAVAKAQRAMSRNEARLSQLEAGKIRLENAPPPAPTDPVEAFCKGMSAPSSAWVRAHPDFVHDKQKNKQMIAAHELAIARGYKADTDDYFKSIEKTLDLSMPAPTVVAAHADDPEPTADTAARATGGRSTAPAAAPVTRSGNGAGSRPGTVRLGPQQQEMARNLFPDAKDPLAEYAKNMTPEERKRGPI